MAMLKGFRLLVIASGSLQLITASAAQVPAPPKSPPTAPAPSPPSELPFTTQVKKSVGFIQAFCLHAPTSEEFNTMTPAQRLDWNPEHLAKLTDDEAAARAQDFFFGTGFIVFVPDTRLSGANRGFLYLVTNRHVAQPGIERGKPCRITRHLVSFNHVGASASDPVFAQSSLLNPGSFTFPTDPSVDLAVATIAWHQPDWDTKSIPLSLFVTPDMIESHQIVEGDPVLFAGLFVQYQGGKRLEPIVRSGSVAMLPVDQITTTLQVPGSVFLTEAHVFGGNSGSPMFVDVSKFKNALGMDYKFLGVVSGEVTETTDLTLQVTSSKPVIQANSDISMVVPAEEIRKLLFCPQLQLARDLAVATDPATRTAVSALGGK